MGTALLLTPERRHFDQHTFKPDVRQAKPSSDEVATRKNNFDFFRRRIRGDVKILGNFAQQQVSYTSADNIGFVACVLQASNHFGGVRAKLFDRKTMACGGNKAGIIDNKILN